MFPNISSSILHDRHYPRSRSNGLIIATTENSDLLFNLHEKGSFGGLARTKLYFSRSNDVNVNNDDVRVRGPDHYIMGHRSVQIIAGLGPSSSSSSIVPFNPEAPKTR